ncbi:DUF4870 domain-containing protein, partial [bacterium]
MESSSQQDRTVAGGMHLASIVAPFIAPAVAGMLWGRSPFVAAHARRAIVEAIWSKLFLVAIAAVSIAISLWQAYGLYQRDFRDWSIWSVLVKFAIVWLIVTILGIINTVVSVRAAVAAYRGELPKTKARQLA